MLDVTIKNDRIHIGERFSVHFQRTLRLPDDGGTYPLPPGLGAFPIRRIADYAGTVPEAWRDHGGVFLPMYQREAMWLSFRGAYWKPSALKVAVGRVNALSGKTWTEQLTKQKQDYVVVPTQPWLDGINAGKGVVKQFVAMPLGMGYTIEGQITGEERFGGIQLICFDPKPGHFPDEEPQDLVDHIMFKGEGEVLGAAPRSSAEMGLAAGGRMRQKIYSDPHGIDTWDSGNYGRVYVHIVNSQMWRDITGEPIPPTPVDAAAYTRAGLPWFDLYDENAGDIDAPDALTNVKSVGEKDAEHGFVGQQDDTPVDVPAVQVVEIGKDKPGDVKDLNW